MTMKRWDGAAFVDIATAKRWDGAAWVDLTVAKRWDGAAWVDIALPGGGGGGLSATVNSSSAAISLHDPSEDAPLVRAMQTFPLTVVTPTGGTGAGPSISWAKLSGASGITVTSPTGFSTRFTANVQLNTPKTAVYRATIVRGVETVYININVSFDYTGGIIP